MQPTAYERNAPDERLVSEALSGSRLGVAWFEDAGPGERYPVLSAGTSADLVVVGGGYLGLWSAWLAKRRDPGLRVVLLEAESIGWAASGRNGGFCEATITHGEANGRSRWPGEYERLAALGMDNLDELEADVAAHGIACDWERPGTLEVAVEEHELAGIRDAPGFLDAAATRAQISSPLFLGGVRDLEECALVQPAKLARELARVAVEAGVEIHEHTPVTHLSGSRGPIGVETPRAVVRAERVLLATNVFAPLLRRNLLMTVPVYDYVLMTEPLTGEQMDAVGWASREGLVDMANQFHYSRLTADNRILWGGYDAIHHRGGRVSAAYEDRPESHRKLASHFLATFPQLEGVRFSHRWAGAIDTCTRFAAFHGVARGGRVAYAAGFTGLGVAATRFSAQVLLDLLAGERTERTELEMVRTRPLPFPPEPVASLGIEMTRWSLDRADHDAGRRNLFLRGLDRVGLGFDS